MREGKLLKSEIVSLNEELFCHLDSSLALGMTVTDKFGFFEIDQSII